MKVDAVDIMFDGNAIVKGDGGDVATEQAGCFNIKEGSDLLKIVEKPP